MKGDPAYRVGKDGKRMEGEPIHFAIDVAGKVNAVTACGISCVRQKGWEIDYQGCAVTCLKCMKWMGIDWPEVEEDDDDGVLAVTEGEEMADYINRLVEAAQLVLEDLYEEAEQNKAEDKIDQDVLDQIEYYEEAVQAVQDNQFELVETEK